MPTVTPGAGEPSGRVTSPLIVLATGAAGADAATFGGVVEGTDGDGSGEGTSGDAGVGEADGSGVVEGVTVGAGAADLGSGAGELAVGVADGSGSVAEADVTPTPSTSDAAAATRPHRTNRRAYLSCWRCTVSTAPEVTTDPGRTVWATASAPRTGSVVVGDGSPDRPNVDPFRASLERVRDAHRPTPRAATRHRSAPPRCGRPSALMSDPAATMSRVLAAAPRRPVAAGRRRAAVADRPG